MTTAALLALALGGTALTGCAVPDSDNDSQTEQASLEPHTTTCASGYACIHAGTTKSTTITNTYFNYECYELYDQYGSHYVENNQTDEAQLAFYTGSSCEQSTLLEGWAAPIHLVVDLERANSIKLYPQ